MKTASYCYIPDLAANQDFLKHLQNFRRKFPLTVLTDGLINYNFGLRILSIPKIGPFDSPGFSRFNRPADRYAFWAFFAALQQAMLDGVDWFTFIEPDCRVNTNEWDEHLFKHLYVNPIVGADHLLGGTPVCWHPWSVSPEFSKAAIALAYNYQYVTGLPMAFEGAHVGTFRTSFYANGAFGLYRTDMLLRAFDELNCYNVLQRRDLREMEEVAVKALAYDLFIGHWLMRQFNERPEELFRRFVFTPKFYSGCGDHHLSLSERLTLLRNNRMHGVHQVKEGNYDF